MTQTSFTHWKKLRNPDYLGSHDLVLPATGEYGTLTLTIKSVEQREIVGTDSRKQMCIVATFQEAVKPMILNATNCKTVKRLAQSPFIENWAGVRIVIGVSKVKAFGDVHDALRVKETAPTAIDSTPIIARVNACKTLDELRKLWDELSATEKTSTGVEDAKERKKGELSK